jgi:threonine synthase
VAAARGWHEGGEPADDDVPTVVLACAHPAKFPDAVSRATGRRPALPERLADLDRRPERAPRLPAELARVRAHIEANARVLTEAA